MKICSKCSLFYQEQIMSCPQCKGTLVEVSLGEALRWTKERSLRDQIGGKGQHKLSDQYKQYHIRSFLGDRSFFLDFDLHKNRLKHGRRLKRFLIAPINVTAIFNIPWFFFNIISTNLFHMEYTEYCSLCDAKHIKGRHDRKECDYNIEYFQILEDILSGHIVHSKSFFEQYADEKQKKGEKSAFGDLFRRPVQLEIFGDLISIGLSVMFWLYLTVYVSLPMFKVLLQKLQQIEAYEVGLMLK